MGERASLVYYSSVNAARRFPHIAASDDDAFSGRPPHASHDSCGRCQAQSARACHDQHGNPGGNPCTGSLAADQHPADESGNGGSYDRWDEDGAGTIHQSLHGGARLLGFFQQPHDLGMGCFGAHSPGFHRQKPGGVQRGSNDFIAWLHSNGDRFAGEERLVYGGVSRYHHPVGGDLFARSHHEARPYREVFNRNVGAVFQACCGDAELGQRSHRILRSGLGAAF